MRREHHRCLARVGTEPVAGLHQFDEDGIQHLGMGLGVGRTGQVVALVLRQGRAIGQGAGGQLVARGAEEGLPGHPGIHLVVLEGGAAIGRGQVRRLDVGELQAGLGQGRDQQVVAAGGLGHGNGAALEVGGALQRRVLVHDDGLGGGRGGFQGEVGELRARRLGEYGHGVRDIGGEIDIADVEGFQQGLAAGELVSADADVLLAQLTLQGALGFKQGDQGGGLLIADAQRGGGIDGQGAHQAGGQGECEQGSATERTRVGHGHLVDCAVRHATRPELGTLDGVRPVFRLAKANDLKDVSQIPLWN
ncbi:hypothetical protein D9M69_484650 [compost metagenome]